MVADLLLELPNDGPLAKDSLTLKLVRGKKVF